MTDVALAVTSVVAAREDQVHRKLGDEALVLGVARGAYFGLDPVGARVWELLQQPVAVEAIIAQLLAEYDVEREACEADLLGFLGELLEHGLIDVHE